MGKIDEEELIYDDGRWVICEVTGTQTGRWPRRNQAGLTKRGPPCKILHRHRVIERGPNRTWRRVNYWPCDPIDLKGKRGNWIAKLVRCTWCHEAVPDEVIAARDFIELMGK